MKTDNFKVASLDIGSNSFLLLLCEANPTGITKIHNDVIEIVRLGQGLAASKRFASEALDRAKQTLKRFKDLIDAYAPDVVLAKATAAARIAENRNELLEIGRQLGIEIETIPGEQEAKVTYQGVSWGQSLSANDYNLLIDIGGGSTELIVGRGANIEYSISIPFGAVLLTERFITGYPVSDEDDKKLTAEIDVGIAKALQSIQKFSIANVLAVAGTPTTLAQIIQGGYDDAKINGSILSVKTLKDLEDKMKARTPEQRMKEMGIPKGRADILYAGTILLRKLVMAIHRNEVKVSTRGVRHGIVADYFLSDPKTIK
jgi:exopolyphosphatase / guanosine-5'-triphosphate,3'-diphosphate pyrophosphatase